MEACSEPQGRAGGGGEGARMARAGPTDMPHDGRIRRLGMSPADSFTVLLTRYTDFHMNSEYVHCMLREANKGHLAPNRMHAGGKREGVMGNSKKFGQPWRLDSRHRLAASRSSITHPARPRLAGRCSRSRSRALRHDEVCHRAWAL